METERTFTCSNCHHTHPISDLREFEGYQLCSTCFEEQTVVCQQCGKRIWVDENMGDSSTPLCQRCYDRDYTTCSRCGRVIHEDNAYYENEYSDNPLCYGCYNRSRSNRVIHDYYYKPEPIFYGNSSRYFGVELEIDDGGEDTANACKLLDIANEDGTERLYIKHDGSLDEGMELVTHPMTLDYHLKEMPWEALTEKAIDMGYYSHQSGTCGLHVHVNRTAFGETEAEQDSSISRVLYFVEKHWNELLRFSRRTQSQLDQWAARYGYKDHPKEMMEHVKKGRGNRYTCVNLTNDHTIEFRIFRGTLKLNTILATLQLVDRICDVAIHLSDDELKAMSWATFVSGCQQPELMQYLKERRLYVNEPVSGEEER